MMLRLAATSLLALAGECWMAAPAAALENGTSHLPPGTTLFYAGALPPPGVYWQNITSYATSSRLNDDHGRRIPIDYAQHVVANTTRLVWTLDQRVLGAQISTQLFTPIIDLELSVFGHRDGSSGLSDVQFSPVILTWRLGANLQVTAGLDILAPTGTYSVRRLANPGFNYWTVMPSVGINYNDPAGFSFAALPSVVLNTENHATRYQSGTVLTVDYAAGWNFGRFRAGVAGYALTQVSDDERRDVKVAPNGNRSRAIGIGPAFLWDLGVLQVQGSYQHDVLAENRARRDFFLLSLAGRF